MKDPMSKVLYRHDDSKQVFGLDALPHGDGMVSVFRWALDLAVSPPARFDLDYRVMSADDADKLMASDS